MKALCNLLGQYILLSKTLEDIDDEVRGLREFTTLSPKRIIQVEALAADEGKVHILFRMSGSHFCGTEFLFSELADHEAVREKLTKLFEDFAQEVDAFEAGIDDSA